MFPDTDTDTAWKLIFIGMWCSDYCQNTNTGFDGEFISFAADTDTHFNSVGINSVFIFDATVTDVRHEKTITKGS